MPLVAAGVAGRDGTSRNGVRVGVSIRVRVRVKLGTGLKVRRREHLRVMVSADRGMLAGGTG